MFAANEGVLDDIENKNISQFKKDWFDYYSANMPQLIERLNNGEALTDDDKKDLSKNLDSFKNTFVNA